ncbi:hypothetical protein [Streptosporangium roseum]|uniref:hypothetical protein n=1 Tax=Streptosporangium roseum TaxID=2001 RepID=UPI00332A4001
MAVGGLVAVLARLGQVSGVPGRHERGRSALGHPAGAAPLPRLPAARRLPSLALHPTCSSARLGLDPAITRIAEAVAERVVIPDGWQCCAFAGDRGLLHPELTASATASEAAVVTVGDFAAHASVNRTCELGLTRATGKPYRHLLELLDEVTA